MFHLYPEMLLYNTHNCIIVSFVVLTLTAVILSCNIYVLHYLRSRMLMQMDEMVYTDNSVKRRELFKKYVGREFAAVSLNAVHILLLFADMLFSVYIIQNSTMSHTTFFLLCEIMTLQIIYLLNTCILTKSLQYMGNLYYRM
mgnify:CR=1 FL=1